MRWFKHMTASWDDERLAALADRAGLEGYGFWWRVVEIVAEKVDEHGQTSAEFSAKKWGNSLGISPKKFRTLAELCANLGLFCIYFSENMVCIDIPNLLKFRDEWTERKSRNSGVTREKLPASRARFLDPDPEAETEEEDKKKNTASASPAAELTPPVLPVLTLPEAEKPKAKEKPKQARAQPPPDGPHYRAKSGRYLTGKRLTGFDRFWAAFDFAKGKAEAADAWLDIPQLTDSLVAQICQAAQREAAGRGEIEAKGGTPKWAQGWLTARRWEDYAPPPRVESKSAAGAAGYIPAYELPPPTPEQAAAARQVRERLLSERQRRMAPGDDGTLSVQGVAP